MWLENGNTEHMSIAQQRFVALWAGERGAGNQPTRQYVAEVDRACSSCFAGSIARCTQTSLVTLTVIRCRSDIGVSGTRIVTRGGRAMTGGAAPIAEIMSAGCGGGTYGVEPIKAALVTLLLSAATLTIP